MSCDLLFILLSLSFYISTVQGSCTNPLQETILRGNYNVTYFPRSEVQILMLDVQFNCTGSVSKLDGMFYVTGLGAHLIAFQIWRPTANNTYEQVSSQYIRDTELNDHPYIPNIQNFSIEPNMYFQRGDIIGFHIPSTGGGVRDPILLVYTNGTSDGNEGRLYYVNSGFSPCKVVLCEETESMLKGVQLQMRMELQQETTTPTPSQSNACVDVKRVETCPLRQTSSSQKYITFTSISTTTVLPTTFETPGMITGTTTSHYDTMCIVLLAFMPLYALAILLIMLVVCVFVIKYKKLKRQLLAADTLSTQEKIPIERTVFIEMTHHSTDNIYGPTDKVIEEIYEN